MHQSWPVQVSQCPPGCVPEESYSSGSEVNREEVEIEIWEKAKREKKSRRRPARRENPGRWPTP